MAREMYLVGVDEEELKPDPKPEPPKTFRGKIANFWYHYKWPTIFIAAGIALTIYIIYQFSVKVEPDYQIDLMVGESLPLGAEDALEQALMPYARDVNGDGQVVIRVDPLVFDGSQMLEQTNNGKLSNHLATGEVMFYIYESEIYDRTIGNKGSEDYIRVTLDTENYRAKREEALRRLANRMANRAIKTGRKVVMEPMNPYERRILHSALQQNDAVTTHSEGEEPNRHVVITLKQQN